MDIQTLYTHFLKSSCVSTDSRNCPAGSIFFALKGDSFDGNKFAANSLEQGAGYVVIDNKEFFVPNDERFILVENSLETLQQLAHHHRIQMKTKVIGITGTNGKTTTKELIAAVLSQKYNVLYTQGNLNNHIGVPLTLLRLKADHEIAVIEMGASHPGEIKELTEMVDPDYGIITNVGKAHLEGFGSLEGVIQTKGELYDYLRNKKDAKVFIDMDNPYLMEMSKGLDLVTYGTEDTAFIQGCVAENSTYLKVNWKHSRNDVMHVVNTWLIGAYNLKNVLAAITIGSYLGVETENINVALQSYRPQNNRSQLLKTERNTLIIDAYNANPTSMMAALENFRDMDAEHKMVILGDMLELGDDSMSEHLRILKFAQSCGFEKIILVGDQFKSFGLLEKCYTNIDGLIEELNINPITGKTILIKGSNGINLRLVIDSL